MIFDQFTTAVFAWAAFTVIAIIAISVCNGCCIAKMLGKPCNK